MMSFIQTDTFLWQSIFYCLLITLSMLPVGLVNPRMMLNSYPTEIRNAVSPLTQAERRQKIFFATPMLLVMIGYPVLVAWMYRPVDSEFEYFLFVIWGMMLVFNLYDLIVLDWLLFCAITPNLIVIPGTKDHPGYKNYLFHFIGFLKGIFITLFISAGLAGVLSLV